MKELEGNQAPGGMRVWGQKWDSGFLKGAQFLRIAYRTLAQQMKNAAAGRGW
jgi:hypothetical protein